MAPDPEFFIHYAPTPPGLSRFLWRFVSLLLLGVVLVGLLLPRLHDQYNLGRNHGRIALEGQLLATPPATELRVPRPGTAPDGTAAFSRYLLTGRGKTGVAPEVLEQAGGWVTLSGTLISRNQLAVIAARSAEPLAGPPAGLSPAEASDPGPGASLGRFSLTGEIVDSKCYPGVMKPGQGKTHRACAIRCLSGGVPAVFRVANRDGQPLYFLLADERGRAVNDRVLDRVADPLRISGEVVRFDNLLMLKADPATYRAA